MIKYTLILAIVTVLCLTLLEMSGSNCLTIGHITDCRGFSDMDAKDWLRSVQEHECEK